jgi:hypothetical protein
VNTATREALAAAPVPVDEAGRPGRCGVGKDDASGLWYTYWLVGLVRQRFGKPYASAREAAAASRWLNERTQS